MRGPFLAVGRVVISSRPHRACVLALRSVQALADYILFTLRLTCFVVSGANCQVASIR